MLSDLFINIVIVAAFLLIIGQIFKTHSFINKTPFKVSVMLGIILGILGCILMIYSINASNNVIVDLRNAAIISAGVMGGPIGAITSSLIIAIYRILYFGLNSTTIFAAASAIVIGIGCAVINYTIKPRIGKFLYSFVYVMAVSIGAFSYLINDYKKLMEIFSYYIPLSIIGIFLAYFTCEYIISRQIIEQELKDSNQQISEILESIQDAFFSLDSNWRFTYINHQLKDIMPKLVRQTKDIIGMDLRTIFRDSEYMHFVQLLNNTMQDRVPNYFEMSSTIMNQWFSVSSYPKRDGISVYLRNITEYKHMQESLIESEERFRAAFEGAAVGMCILTIDGVFIRANNPYCNMVGYTEEELCGMTFWDFTHPEDLHRNSLDLKRLVKGEIQSFGIEKRYIHKKGNIIWVQINASLIRDNEGKALYLIAQGQDITARKKAEEELKNINVELVKQRIEADRQRKAAVEANKHKSQFLANMSHELRTPLNSIIGFTNRVMKKCVEILPETQYENLSIVKHEGYHLLELINSLLDYSKLEAGKVDVQIEKFDLRDIISDIMIIANNFSEEKSLAYKQYLPEDLELSLISDKLKLKQVLINLLSNAFKYSEKGTVVLAVHNEKDYYKIEVIDEGIGIQQEHIVGIFDEFRQVDGSYTRKVGGTGLGLSITKKFVEILGGHIDVHSVVGIGSKFIVRIPKTYGERVKE